MADENDDMNEGEKAARRHRHELQRWFAIVQTLMNKAEEAAENPVYPPPKDAVLGLGERVTVCDVVVKLSGVLGKLIALEREAHRLDERIDPRELSDDQVVRLLERDARSRIHEAGA